MVADQSNIEKLIPHRAPFVMVDNLLSVNRERFESDFVASANNVMVSDGYFTEGGLMENIAQTCAASFGYLDSLQGGEPKIGFIGAISRVVVHKLPPHSMKINTVVESTHQLGNIFMVNGRLKRP